MKRFNKRYLVLFALLLIVSLGFVQYLLLKVNYKEYESLILNRNWRRINVITEIVESNSKGVSVKECEVRTYKANNIFNLENCLPLKISDGTWFIEGANLTISYTQVNSFTLDEGVTSSEIVKNEKIFYISEELLILRKGIILKFYKKNN